MENPKGRSPVDVLPSPYSFLRGGIQYHFPGSGITVQRCVGNSGAKHTFPTNKCSRSTKPNKKKTKKHAARSENPTCSSTMWVCLPCWGDFFLYLDPFEQPEKGTAKHVSKFRTGEFAFGFRFSALNRWAPVGFNPKTALVETTKPTKKPHLDSP